MTAAGVNETAPSGGLLKVLGRVALVVVVLGGVLIVVMVKGSSHSADWRDSNQRQTVATLRNYVLAQALYEDRDKNAGYAAQYPVLQDQKGVADKQLGNADFAAALN